MNGGNNIIIVTETADIVTQRIAEASRVEPAGPEAGNNVQTMVSPTHSPAG
jgi:hypothetical protein